MDDNKYDEGHPQNPVDVDEMHSYVSSNRQKLPVHNASCLQTVGDQYVDNEVEDDAEDAEEFGEEAEMDDDDDDDDDDEGDGVQRIGYSENDENEDDDDDVLGREMEEKRKVCKMRIEDIDFDKHPKKRKLKNLISNYEFAPRVAAPSSGATSAPKQSIRGRNLLADWTEHETFILLDAWGKNFLLNGRKSLRSEEWQEVAEKVSHESKIRRTDNQCRNRLDTLKKKYKKEKIKLATTSSKWVYFKKMDMLMSSSPWQASHPRDDSNNSNGFVEMKDRSGISESAKREADDSNAIPPKKRSLKAINNKGSSLRVLSDCMHKFSEVYKNIEQNKRQQMIELEKMRKDFHKDLEMHKKQILEKARAEISKILQDDDEEYNSSGGNISR